MDAARRIRKPESLPAEPLRLATQQAIAHAPARTPELGLIVTPPLQHARSTAEAPMKRVFDIVVSATSLVLLSPLMALIYVLVVTTSKGPALHRSPRVGRFGRVFMMPKFRTMYVGGPDCARESLDRAENCITPIGHMLRRSGLDELPQLVSVLRGEMSLIGPRPLLMNDPATLERAKFPVVLDVRPGISGLAQVSGRNLVTPRRKARLDAFYARSASLRFDLILLARTLAVIITGKGFL